VGLDNQAGAKKNLPIVPKTVDHPCSTISGHLTGGGRDTHRQKTLKGEGKETDDTGVHSNSPENCTAHVGSEQCGGGAVCELGHVRGL